MIVYCISADLPARAALYSEGFPDQEFPAKFHDSYKVKFRLKSSLTEVNIMYGSYMPNYTSFIDRGP